VAALAHDWLELEAGHVGAEARQSQDRYGAVRERKRWKQQRQEEEERGMGSTPPWAALFIGGPANLSVAAPSTIQYASTTPSQEVREKIKADFSLADYNHDLNPSLGR
jgi:hypothetical protein